MTVLPRVLSGLYVIFSLLFLTACGGSDKTEDATAVAVSASTASLDIGFPERFSYDFRYGQRRERRAVTQCYSPVQYRLRQLSVQQKS